MLVMLAFIFALLGPLRSFTSSSSSGSMGGTFSSEIPSFSFGLKRFTESMMQFVRFFSDDVQTLIYGAETTVIYFYKSVEFLFNDLIQSYCNNFLGMKYKVIVT
jgi:hypothetical protein